MELRDYIKVYWQQRWMIIIIVILSAGMTALIAGTKPERTGVSISFAINRTNREATTQYQYDGFYALQAADLFAQTVVSWFNTPSVLREVYEKAKLDPEIQSLNSLPSRFSVRKYSAQNIVVKFDERTEDRAAKVADGLKLVMEEKSKILNQTAEGKSIFAIVAGTPVVAPVRPPVLLLTAIAAVLSLAAGLFIAAARHYLR